MIFLNSTQIHELLNIVDSFHTIYIASNVGTSHLSNTDKLLLKSIGVDPKSIEKNSIIKDAYSLGLLVDAIGDDRAKNMSYDSFKKFLGSGNFIPLTFEEEKAVEALEYHAYSDIKSLSDRVKKDVSNSIIGNEKKNRGKYLDIVKEEAQKTLLQRKSISEFKSNLGHKTGKWMFDLDRITDFVSHSAFDEGVAKGIEKKHGKHAEVYKEVYEGACPHCIRLYLTGGIGSEPIVFRLSTLIANGNNVGRKAKDWKAVIGSTHSFCRCQTKHKPLNSEWNAENKMFEEKLISTEKTGSKVKIKF